VKRLLTNLRDQPVELHVADKVTVLGPRETVEVDESDAGTPQIQVLVRQRLLAVRQAAEVEPADTTAERTAEKPAESTAKKKAGRGPQTNVKGDE
jgi:hypothetical protein